MRKVSVLEYGAIPNVEKLQTECLQKAIDEMFLAGGGEVFVPAGTFRTGGLRLRSHVTLHLLENARIEGSRDCEEYMAHLRDSIEPLRPEEPESNWYTEKDTPAYALSRAAHAVSRWDNALIKAIHARDVAIIGEKGSVISGANCYDATGEEKYRGPHAIHMYDCRGITLRGYTVEDSANWANTFFFCQNIDAARLRVLAGHDGFHVRGCDNVLLRDCDFQSGDDCVAGFANRNVVVQRCGINTACNGMRFGGTNVLVEDCRFYGPARYVFRGSLTPEEKAQGAPGRKEPGHRYNMLSAFDYFCDESIPVPCLPGHILLRNCSIENVDRLLQYNFSGNDPWQSGSPMKDITFENVTATGITMPLVAYGAPDCPVDVTLRNLTFAFRSGFERADFMQVGNYHQILLENCTLANVESRPLVRTWGDGVVTMRHVSSACPESERIAPAEGEFYSVRI